MRKHNDEYLPHISESIGDSLFQTTDNDAQPGFSGEDRLFLSMMDREFHRGDNGQWIATMPLKEPRRRLPDNRQQAHILDIRLKKNQVKCQHATTFMQKFLDSGHAKRAPYPSLKKKNFGTFRFSACIIPKSPIKLEWFSIRLRNSTVFP